MNIQSKVDVKTRASIIAYDFAGKIVYQQQLLTASGRLDIEIPGSAFKHNGLYMVRIQGKKLDETRKIIVR